MTASIFDPQKEIADLKRRVEYLEKQSPDYGKAIAYAQSLQEVPYDAYTTKLHNNYTAFNIGNLQELKNDSKLLEVIKENKLD